MSLFAERALGIDVSDGTLKAVLLSARGRRVRLHGAWRVPYFGEPDAERGGREALLAFLRARAPGDRVRVVLSAPDRGHFSRTYVVPAMDADQVEELVRYEVLRELQTPESELLIRHHRRRGVVEEQVHALAVPRRPVEALVNRLHDAGLPWDALVAPAFALASFVEHEQPSGRDRVLLGVGQLATQLALVREDGLWTRHLPLGLQHEERPERLAARLASEVRAAVQSALPPDARFEAHEVLLSEEGAFSAALTGALSRELDAPVRRFDDLARVETPRRWGEPDRAELLSMGKAFGLALSGLGLDRFRAPVLQDDTRAITARRSPITQVLLLLAALTVFASSAWIAAHLESLGERLPGARAAELQDLDRQAEEAQAQLAVDQEENDTLRALALRRRATFAVRRALAASSDLVAERRELGPLHLQSVWLSPPRPGRAGLLTLTFDGVAEHAEALDAAFAERLGPLAATLQVAGPVDTPEGDGARWTVELELP